MGARTFVETATALCDEARALGVSTGLLLHGESGPAVIAVDNVGYLTDDERRFVLGPENWEVNPAFVALRARAEAFGDEVLGGERYREAAERAGITHRFTNHLVIPLFVPSGWFATAMFAHVEPFGVEVERQLAQLGLKLAVWCAAHGIERVPDSAARAALGPQQHRIARLAAEGRTNPEIRDALGISVNTVKARLKEVFERLAVGNRTELARVVMRLAPLEGVAPGITRLPTVTVTRVEAGERAVRPARRSGS